MDLCVRGWDRELQRRLRTEGLRRGLTVRELLELAAEEWLSRNEGKRLRASKNLKTKSEGGPSPETPTRRAD